MRPAANIPGANKKRGALYVAFFIIRDIE